MIDEFISGLYFPGHYLEVGHFTEVGFDLCLIDKEYAGPVWIGSYCLAFIGQLWFGVCRGGGYVIDEAHHTTTSHISLGRHTE